VIVALATVDAPAFNVPATIVLPFDALTVNMLVLTPKLPTASNVPPIVVAPVIPTVEPKVEAPVASNVVPTLAEPVTVALANVAKPLEVIVVTEVWPVIPIVPTTEPLLLTVRSFEIVTSSGKPICIVSNPEPTATSISLVVPDTTNVSLLEIVVVLVPSDKLKPPAATESTYALVAAS